MSLPTSFGGTPQEDPNHHFRHAILEFKKTVKSSKDMAKLDEQMDRFVNVSKQMNWNPKSTGTYHKDEGEKIANKVMNEYRRYVKAVQTDSKNADPENLLDALSEVERLIMSQKVY